MHRTLDFIKTLMRQLGGEGSLNEPPQQGWRRQNPHMHLTEATLVACAAASEERFADLFQTHFFDPKTSTLANGIVAPGHHFEWA